MMMRLFANWTAMGWQSRWWRREPFIAEVAHEFVADGVVPWVGTAF